MADINERKRDDNNVTGEAVGNSVGAFAGDTKASALDPFGSAALGNQAGEGTVDDDNHGSKKRD